MEQLPYPFDEGVQIVELARNAQKLFERQQPREKRRLVNFVLSNCSWENGEVAATFRQPFGLLACDARVDEFRLQFG
jgi:site-specific DNA recombinase